jgi:ABC-type multidrug transport system ATPase subunit
VIVFDRVGKRYRSWTGREINALEDFSLEILPGEVLGLAGPNGAGKSTLIALLLGFLGPTAGTVRIDGLAPRRYAARNGVGYLSELVNIPSAWRLESALHRYALLAGVPADETDARVDSVVTLLGLQAQRTKRVRQLSKGNLQRLGLAQTLLHDERVMVLDEPTHGLDPVWTQRFREVVDQLRHPDRTILIASHNLDELSRLADRVAIMDRGRLRRVVDVRASERVVAGDLPYRLILMQGEALVPAVFPDARRTAPGEYELRGLSIAAINAGLGRLVQDGAIVTALHPLRSVLEQQFRDAVAPEEPR